MSIDKLQAALAAVTNEVTVAAAKINFDFTLVKYEAPKEYQPLGELLSANRKSNAETGTCHIIARRLGALFEGVCPDTPNLIKAYGTRVSEISASCKEKDQSDFSKSMLAAYAGIDGTSIWAAATSSKTSLHVHLLSCMLARLFEAPEAISIWVELIKERRRDIAAKLERGESLPFNLATAAAQHDIQRTHIAEWDSSARSWLRTADSIKATEHNQLKSLLNEINLPVNDDIHVFSSVTAAWTSALETMEKLISGIPQAVRYGAVVVGLSAWHLYPNLAIFGTQNFEVNMADSLIRPGGTLSLGLSSSKSTARGIYWCLTLAHLRHYGRPVRTECRLQDDPTRITFTQLIQASLGAILGRWGMSTSEISDGLRLLRQLCNTLKMTGKETIQCSWIQLVVDALNGQDNDPFFWKLLDLGQRRSGIFIGSDPDQGTSETKEPPVFGLLEISTLLKIIHGNENHIQLLRRIASRVPNFEHSELIIRYKSFGHTGTIGCAGEHLADKNG
jgi:hypothetical protein